MSTLSRFDLSGRAGILTGASGLLGRQFAVTLLEAGAQLALVDQSPAAGVEHERALRLTADVSRPGDVDTMVARTLERFGRLDFLVCSAAIDPKLDAPVASQNACRFEDYPLEAWQRSLDVNLTGVFLCCQRAGKAMVERGRGSIVNLGSTYGRVAPDQRLYERDGEAQQQLWKPAAYPVTKAAVAHLSRYLATYWRGTGVRVNTLVPHGVRNQQEAQFQRRFAERSPMGRMAELDEMNAGLLFLVSDASSYMTGAELVIDGGWSAW